VLVRGASRGASLQTRRYMRTRAHVCACMCVSARVCACLQFCPVCVCVCVPVMCVSNILLFTSGVSVMRVCNILLFASSRGGDGGASVGKKKLLRGHLVLVLMIVCGGVSGGGRARTSLGLEISTLLMRPDIMHFTPVYMGTRTAPIFSILPSGRVLVSTNF
jgi:hypothetical protein